MSATVEEKIGKGHREILERLERISKRVGVLCERTEAMGIFLYGCPQSEKKKPDVVATGGIILITIQTLQTIESDLCDLEGNVSFLEEGKPASHG